MVHQLNQNYLETIISLHYRGTQPFWRTETKNENAVRDMYCAATYIAAQ